MVRLPLQRTKTVNRAVESAYPCFPSLGNGQVGPYELITAALKELRKSFTDDDCFFRFPAANKDVEGADIDAIGLYAYGPTWSERTGGATLVRLKRWAEELLDEKLLVVDRPSMIRDGDVHLTMNMVRPSSVSQYVFSGYDYKQIASLSGEFLIKNSKKRVF